MKTVRLLYGKTGMELHVPDSAAVLEGQNVPSVADPQEAVRRALETPIGCPPLRELIARKKPRTVAITISDITRPVPNRQFLPPLLGVLNEAGVEDSQIVVIIGTGMHRPSSPGERDILLGPEIQSRLEVIDHKAADAATLVEVSRDPPVSVCRRFAEADFRICTGYIEPHFMAGFSGGRKGVCPAMVDLKTIQRFHGYETLNHPLADNGVLEGNPCHEIALKVARTVGVDFLLNVALSRDRQIAGVYCGDLVEAHLAGCRQVERWVTAKVDAPYDLVITNGGGFPLDQTFYQTVKGMCTAMPALDKHSTLLVVSHCGEQVGSDAYLYLMMKWGDDWRGFLSQLAANKDRTELDQWEFQMQAKVLALIGPEKLLFASDGVPQRVQMHLAVNPLLSSGDARARVQRAIDEYLAKNRSARVAVIPDGPYTMLRRRAEG
jgi:nickel-dependent lactate racemase